MTRKFPKLHWSRCDLFDPISSGTAHRLDLCPQAGFGGVVFSSGLDLDWRGHDSIQNGADSILSVTICGFLLYSIWWVSSRKKRSLAL